MTLLEGLQSIGEDVFRDCQRLKEIVLPKSLQTITGNPFSECKVAVTSLSPKFKAVDGALYGNHGKRLIYAYTSGKRYQVAEGVEIIGKEALGMELDELTIPASVRTIEPTHCASSVKHLVFKGEVRKMPNEPIYELFANVERITIPQGTSSHYVKLFRFVIEEE